MSAQINLFNPAFRKQKKYFTSTHMAIGLGVLAAALLATPLYLNAQLADLRKEADASSAALTARQAELAKVNAETGAKTKNEALDLQAEALEAEARSLTLVANMLGKGGLGNAAGYAEYMRAFARQVREGIWLTGFDIAGNGTEIVLQGRAVQADLVPAYIARLANEPVLRGKSFATLDMETPKLAEGASAPPAQYTEFTLRSSVREEPAQGKAEAP